MSGMSLCLLLAATILGAAQAASYPVISVGACGPACKALPARMEAACTGCLLSQGKIARFGNNGTYLQRLPMPELGYTAIPAFSLSYPFRYLYLNVQELLAGIVEGTAGPVLEHLGSASLYSYPYQGLTKPYQTFCDPYNATNCRTARFGDHYKVVRDAITPPIKAALERTCNCTISDSQLGSISMYYNSCVDEMGFLGGMTPSSAFPLCPRANILVQLQSGGTLIGGTRRPPYDQNWVYNNPAQLAYSYPASTEYGSKYAAWGPQAEKEGIAYYTDVTAAADSFWDIMHNGYAMSLYIKFVTKADEPRIMSEFGSDYTPKIAALLKAGKLYEMDLGTWQAEFNKGLVNVSLNGTAPWAWNIATHLLFEYIIVPGCYSATVPPTKPKEGVHLRAVAVRLFGLTTSDASAVFTPAKSPTAFILAMAASRAAFLAQLIWVGHVYHTHLIPSAVSYALFSSIDTSTPVYKSTHPVRLLLDTYTDASYSQGFSSTLMSGMFIMPVVIPTPDLPRLYEIAANNGPMGQNEQNNLYTSQPEQMLMRSKMDVKKFTSPGGKPWDLYPGALTHLENKALARSLARNVLKVYYKSDADVAADAGVQAFAAALMDPMGANIRAFSKTNKITTLEELIDICGITIYYTVSHGLSHIQDYVIRGYSVAHAPLTTSLYAMPDPTKDYSIKELMYGAPNFYAVSRQVIFQSSMTGSSLMSDPMGKIGSNGKVDWNANLNFPSDAKGKAAAAATIAYRKALSIWLDKPHNWYIKASNTNFGPPVARVPLIIDV